MKDCGRTGRNKALKDKVFSLLKTSEQEESGKTRWSCASTRGSETERVWNTKERSAHVHKTVKMFLPFLINFFFFWMSTQRHPILLLRNGPKRKTYLNSVRSLMSNRDIQQQCHIYKSLQNRHKVVNFASCEALGEEYLVSFI